MDECVLWTTKAFSVYNRRRVKLWHDDGAFGWLNPTENQGVFRKKKAAIVTTPGVVIYYASHNSINVG
jgi:hypothetical protein